VRSKEGHTLADRAATHALRFLAGTKPVSIRDYDPVGSDERQYCSPGINWPVGSLLRSRHGEYAVYHTSKDDMTFVSEQGLAGSYAAYVRVLQVVEINCRPRRTNPYCEPQLGQYGLYSSMVTASVDESVRRLLHILAFADGEHDLIDIATGLDLPAWILLPSMEALVRAGLITLGD
jgi:aminopeptidase-like protein